MLRTSSHSLALCLALATSATAQTCLSTTFANNNGGATGGSVYFDIEVTNATGITITDLEVHTTADAVPIDVTVYITPGTSVGNEGDPGVWNMVSTGSGTAMGVGVPSPIDVADFNLAPGTYGMSLESGAGVWAHTYTNGQNTFSNADITLELGSASNVPFTPGFFSPRTWNGTICYEQGVIECFLLVGVDPLNLQLGNLLAPYATNQDVLLVDPLVITPMSLSNLPEFEVPSNAPIGASIYTQGLLMNPWVFPNDPIKLSQAIEWQVGTSTSSYGFPSGLSLWSTSPAAVQPGQTMSMSFTIF